MLTIGKLNLCDLCFAEVGKKEKSCPYCNGKKNIERYPTSLKEGTVLAGRYCVGRILGKGGFGITYLAYDLKENKKVAIKEYMPDSLAHRNVGEATVSTLGGEKNRQFESGAQKFFEEAKLVSRFNGNPNIIGVYEFFNENNTTYFVMEYLSGIDMKDYLTKNGACPEAEMLYIVDKVTEALIMVHSMNTLHRDISPDNIFLCENGAVKLIDFGAARHVMADESNSLSVIIKHGFAPMEQYSSKGKQGPWTDIYALGASIYYGLTGRKANDAPSRYDDPTLDLSGVSPEFAHIIGKMMEVDARDRYQNVLELRNDLAALPFEPVAPIIATTVQLPPQPVQNTETLSSARSVSVSKTNTTSTIKSEEKPKAAPIPKSVTKTKSSTVAATESKANSESKSKSKKWLIPVIAGAACLTLVLSLIPVFAFGSNGSNIDYENTPPTAELNGDATSSNSDIWSDEYGEQNMSVDGESQGDNKSNTSDIQNNAGGQNSADGQNNASGNTAQNGTTNPSTQNNNGGSGAGNQGGSEEGATNNTVSSAEKPNANTNANATNNATSKPSSSTNSKPSSTATSKPSTTTSKPHSHSFTTSKVTKEATVSSTGVRTYYCSCGATKTETIPKLKGMEWSFSNGTLTISGNGAIPNYTYTGGKSTAPWMEHKKSITKIVIGSGITSIGNYAFDSLWNVTSVTIPSGVTSIGERAFYWCEKITSITLPATVTSIGKSAFDMCGKLTTINIPGKVTAIPDGAFNRCSDLKSITIPASVKSIGSNAFAKCYDLKTVTIQNSKSNISISSTAFSGCSPKISYTK